MNDSIFTTMTTEFTDALPAYVRGFGKQGADLAQILRWAVGRYADRDAATRIAARQALAHLKADGVLRGWTIKGRPGYSGEMWATK